MIKANSFSKEWIDSLRVRKKKIDTTLCEKMIRALGLLEQLVTNGLDLFQRRNFPHFTYRKAAKVSIDIDINVNESKENLIKILDKMNSTSLFKYYKEKKRKDGGIPKAHFNFYYDSAV